MPGRGLVLIGLLGRGEQNQGQGEARVEHEKEVVLCSLQNWLTSLNKCHDLHTAVPGTHRLGDIWDLAVWLGRPVKPHPPGVT